MSGPGSPQGGREQTLRLFHALWPDEAVRQALRARQLAWQWPARARLVPPDKLHLTLHFLGSVSLTHACVLQQAPAVAWEAFACRLERAGRWGEVAWLAPAHVPGALQALHEALGVQLRELGVAYDPRPYAPHVTLARDAAGARPPAAVEPVDWTVREYALVLSRPTGRYEVLRRFPAMVR